MLDTGLEPAGFIAYDKALKEFLTFKIYPDEQDEDVSITLVPVTGPPVLNLGTQNVLNPDSSNTTNERQNQIVKLPATSLTQLGWTFDLSRWTKAHFRRLGWTEEGNKVIQSPQLVPVDVMYQLDLWSKYRSTMNLMVRNILIKFVNREVWLEVDLKGVWGKRYIPFTLLYNGPENLSDIEPKDKDRTVRMAFSFQLHAWIIPDATMIPAVREVIKQIYYPTKNSVPFPSPADLPPYPDWILERTPTQSIETIPVNEQNP